MQSRKSTDRHDLPELSQASFPFAASELIAAFESTARVKLVGVDAYNFGSSLAYNPEKSLELFSALSRALPSESRENAPDDPNSGIKESATPELNVLARCVYFTTVSAASRANLMAFRDRNSPSLPEILRVIVAGKDLMAAIKCEFDLDGESLRLYGINTKFIDSSIEDAAKATTPRRWRPI